MTEAPTDQPASPPAREELYFDSLKERRGAYFIEYQRLGADATFATMNVVFVDKPEDAAVVAAMMEELRLTQCRITLLH